MLVRFPLQKLRWPLEGVEMVVHLELSARELGEKHLHVPPFFRLGELKDEGFFPFPDVREM